MITIILKVLGKIPHIQEQGNYVRLLRLLVTAHVEPSECNKIHQKTQETLHKFAVLRLN